MKSYFRSFGAIVALSLMSAFAVAQPAEMQTPGTAANVIAAVASPGKAKCDTSVGSVFAAKAPSCVLAFWRKPATPRVAESVVTAGVARDSWRASRAVSGKVVERYAKRDS